MGKKWDKLVARIEALEKMIGLGGKKTSPKKKPAKAKKKKAAKPAVKSRPAPKRAKKARRAKKTPPPVPAR